MKCHFDDDFVNGLRSWVMIMDDPMMITMALIMMQSSSHSHIITKIKKKVLIMTRVVKMMIWLMGKRRSRATVSLWKVSTAATAG